MWRLIACVILAFLVLAAGGFSWFQSDHIANLERTIAADQVAQDSARADYQSLLERSGRDVAEAQAKASLAEHQLTDVRRGFDDYRAQVGRVVNQGIGFAQSVSRDGIGNLDLIDRCIDDLERYLESLDSLRRLGGQY